MDVQSQHRSTRPQYHKAVKLCQSKDSAHRKQRMAESLQNNTGRDIFRELKPLIPKINFYVDL